MKIFKKKYKASIYPNKDYPIYPNRKKILIFFANSIGDYILFRNFLKTIYYSKKYQQAEITLVLSSCVKGIPEFLDKEYIFNIIYIPHNLFKKSIYQQENTIQYIFSKNINYDEIIFPSFNVNVFKNIHKTLIHCCSAQEIIGTTGDIGICNDELFLEYTKIFPLQQVQFDFNLTKEFFEWLIEEPILETMPIIDLKKQSARTNYAVISIGAQDPFRKWHIRNYSHICQYLQDNYGLSIYLIGGLTEKNEIEQLNKLCNNTCISYVGKNFENVINLINHAKIYIGNDSGFFHVAAALKTKAICIASGSHPIFTNYPPSSRYIILIHEVIKKYFLKNFHDTGNNTAGYLTSTVDINAVSQAIHQLLDTHYYNF